MDSVLATPSWAYDFCYYFAFVAAIVVVSTIYMLVKLMMLPSMVKKFLPMTQLTLTMVLSGLVGVVLTMMQFWICRGALKSTEKFAVQCTGEADCTDVMGPQGSNTMCACGKRGCGGCYMNNQSDHDLSGF
jgi:hypothetical protein